MQLLRVRLNIRLVCYACDCECDHVTSVETKLNLLKTQQLVQQAHSLTSVILWSSMSMSKEFFLLLI